MRRCGAVHGAVHGAVDAAAADDVGADAAAQRRGAAPGLRDRQPTAAAWGCPHWRLCAVMVAERATKFWTKYHNVYSAKDAKTLLAFNYRLTNKYFKFRNRVVSVSDVDLSVGSPIPDDAGGWHDPRPAADPPLKRE